MQKQRMLGSVKQVLAACDATLKPCVERFLKRKRKLFTELATHLELRQTYRKAMEDNALLQSLRQEAERGWLFLDSYIAIAEPIDTLASYKARMDSQAKRRAEIEASGHVAPELKYKVDEHFLDLNRKHIQEQQDIIIAHQETCLRKLRKKTTSPA